MARKTFITRLNGMARVSTAQIAQQLVSEVGRELGTYDMAVYRYPVEYDSEMELVKRLDGIIAGVGHGDHIIFQYPTWNDRIFDEYFLRQIRQFPDVQVTIFVHDVVGLMWSENIPYVSEEIYHIFNKADSLILPSKHMHERLLKEGLSSTIPVTYQEIWNHRASLVLNDIEKSNYKKVHFAGEVTKFKFVQKWTEMISLDIYCWESIEELPDMVKNNGWKDDTELLLTLSKGGWGLVWSENDGVSNYFRYCNSFKQGLYLAAGIPLIIPKGISNEHLIIENGLGIAVESLSEAVEIINSMTFEEYEQMVKRVREFSSLIREADFTRRALINCKFDVRHVK